MEQHLNKLAKEYLLKIKEECSTFMTKEQKEYLEILLTRESIVVIEENEQSYVENQREAISSDPILSEEDKEKHISRIKTPIAHGGRVFEDEKIHFYPFLIEGDNKQKVCEDLLMHELLHFFIRPTYIPIKTRSLEGLNTYVSEGMVDLVARYLQEKLGIADEYKSNYAENVIFLKDAMSNLIPEEQVQTIFHSNIADIISNERIKPIGESKNIANSFSMLVTELVELCTEEHRHALWYTLMNTTANQKDLPYMINYLRGIFHAQAPDKMEEINKLIDEYKVELGLEKPISENTGLNM
jgi:hypothetical protein